MVADLFRLQMAQMGTQRCHQIGNSRRMETPVLLSRETTTTYHEANRLHLYTSRIDVPLATASKYERIATIRGIR